MHDKLDSKKNLLDKMTTYDNTNNNYNLNDNVFIQGEAKLKKVDEAFRKEKSSLQYAIIKSLMRLITIYHISNSHI